VCSSDLRCLWSLFVIRWAKGSRSQAGWSLSFWMCPTELVVGGSTISRTNTPDCLALRALTPAWVNHRSNKYEYRSVELGTPCWCGWGVATSGDPAAVAVGRFC